MGFGTRKSNTSYWTIMMGSIRKKVNADVAGAQKRVNKNGDDVWELVEDNYTGTLNNIQIKEGTFGDEMHLEFPGITIRFNVYSQYGRNFLLRFPKLDLNEEFTITPYEFNDDGKNRVGVSIIQNDEKIKAFWTKDNPGDKPDWEQKKSQGKMVWNNDAEMEYLVECFNGKLKKDKFEPKNVAAPEVEEPTPEVVNEPAGGIDLEEEDDLPF